jgi:glutaredoxin-like protein NrdH
MYATKEVIMEHIKGKNKGDIMMYTLSTCIWCKKTKALFKELGVEFKYEDVDLLEGDDEDRVNTEMEGYASNVSFPLIIVDGKKFAMGFEEEKIRKKFGK